MNVIDILINYHQGFLQGLAVTLQLCAIIWFFGLTLGTGLALLSAKHTKDIGIPVRIISFLLSGIPILVFLFWLHYPAQAIFDLVIDPFYTAAFTLTIFNIFAVCDLVRHGIDDFPEQYNTAAKVCGLSKVKTFWKIQFPIIFRQVFPGILLLQVSMMHMTILTSLISVEEIFRVAQRINSAIYRPVEIYTALGVFFLAISLPINAFALWMKKKYGRNLSES